MNQIISCILLDDERNNLLLLKKLIAKQFPILHVIAEETDSEKGLALIQELKPDLLFLDIHMPGLNGFELLKKLEPLSFEVIFVTAYSEHAIEAFEYHAIGYITKPILDEKLAIAVKNAIDRILQKRTTDNIFTLLESRINNAAESKIPLSTLNGMIFVNEVDIMYCESQGSYTNFYLLDGKKIMVSKPLGEFERSLPSKNFVRIHDKYIINLKYVHEYIKGRGGEIVLTNGGNLPVSVNRKDNLMARFDKWSKK